MAIDFLCETFGRQFKNDITGAQTGTRVYFVKYDTNYDDLDDVITDAVVGGLPALGDSYSPSASSLVAFEQVPSEMDQEKNYYSIAVNYKSNQISYASPTSQDWRISISTIKEQEVLDTTKVNTGLIYPIGQTKAVDITKPILNTAGHSFDPPVTTSRVKTVISLSKNFAAITDLGTMADLDDLVGRVDTINNDALTIADVTGTFFQFLLEDVNVVSTILNSETFLAVTLKITFDPQYHVLKVLNAGFMDANNKEILSDNGQEIQLPWPLDVNGNAIRGGAAVRQTNSIYLAFGDKASSAFADLGLPTSII
jgi:hypothetical protein